MDNLCEDLFSEKGIYYICIIKGIMYDKLFCPDCQTGGCRWFQEYNFMGELE